VLGENTRIDCSIPVAFGI